MIYYKLHNKEKGVDLTVAPFGIWNTSDLNEAKEMLISCRKYVCAMGLTEICQSFILKDFDTNEEIDLQ